MASCARCNNVTDYRRSEDGFTPIPNKLCPSCIEEIGKEKKKKQAEQGRRNKAEAAKGAVKSVIRPQREELPQVPCGYCQKLKNDNGHPYCFDCFKNVRGDCSVCKETECVRLSETPGFVGKFFPNCANCEALFPRCPGGPAGECGARLHLMNVGDEKNPEYELQKVKVDGEEVEQYRPQFAHCKRCRFDKANQGTCKVQRQAPHIAKNGAVQNYRWVACGKTTYLNKNRPGVIDEQCPECFASGAKCRYAECFKSTPLRKGPDGRNKHQLFCTVHFDPKHKQKAEKKAEKEFVMEVKPFTMGPKESKLLPSDCKPHGDRISPFNLPFRAQVGSAAAAAAAAPLAGDDYSDFESDYSDYYDD